MKGWDVRKDSGRGGMEEAIEIQITRTFKGMDVLSACNQSGMLLNILLALFLSGLGPMKNSLFNTILQR